MSPLLLVLSLSAPLSEPTAAEWFPFDFYRESYIYVDAKVGDIETIAVLDSGAGITCISTAIARELELEGGTQGIAEGIGGPVTVEFYPSVRFDVCGLEGVETSVIAIDLSDVAKALGREIPIVLGRNFFTDHVVDIDYPRRRVAFRGREDFDYQGPGAVLELHDTDNGLWSVDLEVEDHPVRLVVDTGNGEPLGLEEHVFAATGLLDDSRPVTTSLSGGAGGMVDARQTTLKSVKIGDTFLTNVPTGLTESDEPGMAMNGESGALGSPLLARFRAIFDAGSHRLILEPNVEALAVPFAKDRFGLETVLEDGALRVLHVCSGSPAAAAGWKTGARIVSIDDHPIGPGYFETMYRWQLSDPGVRRVLVDDAGTEHELVAADFY